MLSELQTSHAYVMGGGDGSMGGDYVPFAMLGADLAVDDEGFRIERIVPGRSWDEQTTSPLAQPWLGVREGDVIIAVDGREVEPGSNPWSMLDGVAGDTVELAILPGDGRESVPGDPDSAGMPFVVDIPVLFDESALRYQAWVDDNRRAVDVASSGRLGYMHLLDMSAAGLSQFGHQFYGQLDKDGLVIDVRDNGGGFVSQLILAQLAQEITGWDVPRHGTPSPYPAHAFPGHMVVLINQNSGSDGDIFPYMFREMGLGPLIGTRTWGGVVGIRADKGSVDGGLTSQPEYATWTPRDGWDIENYGVDPDIEVDITPADRAAGRDPQLDRAVLELRRMLAEDPIERQAAPIYPGAP
jgi:tricorn protease